MCLRAERRRSESFGFKSFITLVPWKHWKHKLIGFDKSFKKIQIWSNVFESQPYQTTILPLTSSCSITLIHFLQWSLFSIFIGCTHQNHDITSFFSAECRTVLLNWKRIWPYLNPTNISPSFQFLFVQPILVRLGGAVGAVSDSARLHDYDASISAQSTNHHQHLHGCAAVGFGIIARWWGNLD